jgi:hypothetical protein
VPGVPRSVSLVQSGRCTRMPQGSAVARLALSLSFTSGAASVGGSAGLPPSCLTKALQATEGRRSLLAPEEPEYLPFGTVARQALRA